MKLDILTNTVKEVMHKISRKEELRCSKTSCSISSRKTRINVPNHFAAWPRYPKPPNDYFMYSIHDTAKDEVQNQMVMEKPPRMMCMFDDLAYVDDFPGYDHQGDDYVVEVDANSQRNQHYLHGKKKPNDHNLKITAKLCILSEIARRKMQKFLRKVQNACPCVLPHS
jgi:hypothetical protein